MESSSHGPQGVRSLLSTYEIYIDDVLLFGAADDEYLDNIRKVLLRLRTGKVTANPEKTELVLGEVEYVGHLLLRRSVYKSWTFHFQRLRKRFCSSSGR